MSVDKILITGLGSIGRRYARLLQARGGVKLFALRSGRWSEPCDGVTDIYTWEEAARCGMKAAFITNPTSVHIDTAIKCAERGMHLFIEKPLDMSLGRLEELKRLVVENGLSAYVAYNLRFHPGVLAMREIVSRDGFDDADVCCSSWLPDWRPGTNHRKCYSANSDMGGGVVLDLSHEPDYASYIFGEISHIEGRAWRKSTVTVDAEDTADMTLHLVGGRRVTVHVDFCSPESVRTVRFSSGKNKYELNLVSNCLSVYSERAEEKRYDIARDFTYKAEIEYFLGNIGRPMMNGLDEAGALLSKLLGFKRASGLK